MLGKLLGALDPGQHYDHMGMLIEDDKKTLRHSTASDDRIAEKEYYTATVKVKTPLGDVEEKLPLAGIRPDIITYAWPGTITQTIGEVCYTGRNRSNPQFGFPTLYDKVISSEINSPPGFGSLTRPNEISERHFMIPRQPQLPSRFHIQIPKNENTTPSSGSK